ncbi:MAG: hypothetical protein HKN82_15380, partial [Akkermansiaceae bacterium]|nr:hypothetical protein [Akkermansiaceae bacterium]
MNTRIASSLLLLAIAAAAALPAHAAAPKKRPSTIYQRLWSDSPFTVKPPPPEAEEAGPGPLEDFTLASVSKLQEGWFVVLMNKKKREERIRIVPGETSGDGFKVLEVKQEPASYKDTKVQLAYKGDTGWVGYEDKFLALKTAAPARQATPQRGTPARGARPG